MANYSENFDGMAEGLSPPTGIVRDTALPGANCEVDDTQSRSAPHSMYVAGGGGSAYCRREEAAGFDTDPVVAYLYVPDAVSFHYFLTQNDAADKNNATIAAHTSLRNDGDIEYYTGGGWVDTLQNYGSGAWHKYEIQHDCGTNTFNMWYDGGQIVNGGGFRNAAASIKSVHWGSGAGDETWVDDISIGTTGWEGTYLGVVNPAKISGIPKAGIAKVDGVESFA